MDGIKNYLIAKYLYYAVYACAYWNNKKPQFFWEKQ